MTQSNLSHHFLIPTDQMGDERFFDCLIYLCRHQDNGAWGFVVNQPNQAVRIGSLLLENHIDAGAVATNTYVLNGGPARSEAGYLLHTGMPVYATSFALSENLCLTTSRDILGDLPNPAKISHYLFLLGFCNWQAGQLEQEIQQGSWLSCPAKLDILFHHNHSQKLKLALSSLGLNPNRFVATLGRS